MVPVMNTCLEHVLKQYIAKPSDWGTNDVFEHNGNTSSMGNTHTHGLDIS